MLKHHHRECKSEQKCGVSITELSPEWHLGKAGKLEVRTETKGKLRPRVKLGCSLRTGECGGDPRREGAVRMNLI